MLFKNSKEKIIVKYKTKYILIYFKIVSFNFLLIKIICPIILLNNVPGKEAIANEAKNIPAVFFSKRKINETRQTNTPKILKILEASDNTSVYCLLILNKKFLNLRSFKSI